MRGNIYGRLERLEGRVPRSKPEVEAREEHFRRCAAILDGLEDYAPLKDRDDIERLIEECVPRGLSHYGLAQEEIAREAPFYVESFHDMFAEGAWS